MKIFQNVIKNSRLVYNIPKKIFQNFREVTQLFRKVLKIQNYTQSSRKSQPGFKMFQKFLKSSRGILNVPQWFRKFQKVPEFV